MNKIFECLPFCHTKLLLTQNRLTAKLSLVSGEIMFDWSFILDTGAVISTMSKSTAVKRKIYDINVINELAYVDSFTKDRVNGRVVKVDRVVLAKLTVQNVLFFIPDSDRDYTEVIGANVLNGIIPIPEFKEKKLWVMRNKDVPSLYHSYNLGIDILTEVLSQDITYCDGLSRKIN